MCKATAEHQTELACKRAGLKSASTDKPLLPCHLNLGTSDFKEMKMKYMVPSQFWP